MRQLFLDSNWYLVAQTKIKSRERKRKEDGNSSIDAMTKGQQHETHIYDAWAANVTGEDRRSFGIIGFLVIDRITSAPVTRSPPAIPNAQL